MSEETSISIPTDEDGFISRKCPDCSKLFKANYEEGSDEPLSHCPYCNATDKYWFTDEQREYVESMAMNFARGVVGEQLGEMVQDFNRSMPSSGFITAKMTHKISPEQPVSPVPTESNEPMPFAHFECCNERIKHDGSSEVLHCVICGMETKV